MDKMLIDFELIITLKEEIFRVDLNYLDKGDLENIDELAYDLGIEDYLTHYDLDDIYNSEYDKIKKIHNQWCIDIMTKFEKVRDELNGRLN